MTPSQTGKNRPRRGRIVAASLIIVVCALVGCGSGGNEASAPVSGKITYDGKPLAAGEVVFVAESGKRSKGNIAEDGTFTLAAPTGDDSPLGASYVCVTATKPNPSGDRFAPPISLIPPRFGQPEYSGMTWDVREGSNRVLIELSSNGHGKVSALSEGE